MDPNEALDSLRMLITEIINEPMEDERQLSLALEVVSLFDGLDTWLERGGFLPNAWRNAKLWPH